MEILAKAKRLKMQKMTTATEVSRNFARKKRILPFAKYRAIMGLSSIVLYVFTRVRVKYASDIISIKRIRRTMKILGS